MVSSAIVRVPGRCGGRQRAFDELVPALPPFSGRDELVGVAREERAERRGVPALTRREVLLDDVADRRFVFRVGGRSLPERAQGEDETERGRRQCHTSCRTSRCTRSDQKLTPVSNWIAKVAGRARRESGENGIKRGRMDVPCVDSGNHQPPQTMLRKLTASKVITTEKGLPNANTRTVPRQSPGRRHFSRRNVQRAVWERLLLTPEALY